MLTLLWTTRTCSAAYLFTVLLLLHSLTTTTTVWALGTGAPTCIDGRSAVGTKATKVCDETRGTPTPLLQPCPFVYCTWFCVKILAHFFLAFSLFFVDRARTQATGISRTSLGRRRSPHSRGFPSTHAWRGFCCAHWCTRAS